MLIFILLLLIDTNTEGVQVPRVAFASEGKMEWYVGRNQSSTGSIVMKRELSRKAKLLIYWSIFVTYPHLWGHDRKIVQEFSGWNGFSQEDGWRLPWRVDEKLRAASLLRQKEPVEVVWWGCPLSASLRRGSRHIQLGGRPQGRPRTVERLYFYTDLGMPWDPPDRAG